MSGLGWGITSDMLVLTFSLDDKSVYIILGNEKVDGRQCRDWVDWSASDILVLTFSLDD